MQSTFNRILPATIIMIGVIIFGCTLKSALADFKDSERVVSVKGLAEREVNADRVIWPLSVRLADNNLQTLYSEVERVQSTIIGFVENGGIAKDEITLSPITMFDNRAQSYSVESPYRYSTTVIVTVASSKVDLVRSLMQSQGELIKKGVALSQEYNAQTQFVFTGLNDIKPQMIEQATKAARASADKFADDSGSDLGKIRSANQGQFSISDRDVNTPYIKRVRVVTTVEYYLND